ncbi:MAG: hypothetical protein WBL21_06990 [Salinimicrobium sp.]
MSLPETYYTQKLKQKGMASWKDQPEGYKRSITSSMSYHVWAHNRKMQVSI